ncbi:uncharacterized protein J4E88_010771 [Alternaria novae-zelandiae]|uniref:uncharacterized protein n=1 Tax=Alternaria novae-zelandiae TaxID=430562 RepID=UPI0020C3DD5D|nr:uncharacterized protein J4E88_010771 [Alternaria novae-zelandiae]KAI4663921.1 hypothetical protein J4E88_010771 [Alternaria novae-zelandiae]
MPPPFAKTPTSSATSSPHITFSTSTPTGTNPYTPSSAQAPMVHQAQKRPRPEDESQEAQAKRARNDSITTSQEQRYNDNKPAIEAWCKAQQTHPKARWYEKLHAWETNGCRDVRRKSPTTASPPTPLPITQTPGMDSPAEILATRQQWGDTKPDARIHPLDKAPVPEYPTEDSLAACTKRPDGLYKCLHPEGSHHKCCSEGLTEKNKKHAIGKQIRAWKTRVEEMVLKGELHVAHKTWGDWNKKCKESYGGEVGRWDGVLGLLGGGLGRKGGGGMAVSPVPRPAAAPASLSAAAPAHQTHFQAARQAVPQGRGLQPFVPSASPTQQMSSLRQTTPAHATSRQFQHQSLPPRSFQHPANTGSIASPEARPVSQAQPQAQHTLTNSPVQDFVPSATSRSPAPAAKRQAGEPAFGYNGLSSNGSHRQQELASFSPQRRSQEHTAIASATAPSFAHHLAQYATSPPQTLSPVASAQSGHHSNGLTTPHSTSRKREQRGPQQQAPKQARNANRQQAEVQLLPSGVTKNHAAKPHPASTQMATSPSTAPKRTSASINTPKMSSTTHTLSPEKSSTLAASSPAKAEPAVDYRPVAMRMLQQQIKDHKPILLGGLKITRDDVNSNMSGCVGRLATALRLEAEEVARMEVEEAARKEAEVAARMKAEAAARKQAEETARANSKDASQGQAETTDEIAALAVSNDNEGHELDYLFSDTPIPASHSHPIDFGNPNDYLFFSSPDSPDNNEWRPEIIPDLPPNFGKVDLIGMTRRAFEEEPSPTSPSQPEEQPEPEQEVDTPADLSYPEAWFIEDVEDFVTSRPLPEWMTRPTTDFTLENMQVEGFDGDLGMPGDPEEWVQATRAWREERDAGAR